MKPSSRDLSAQQLATDAGLLTVPSADDTAELSPERAVLVALGWHLGRVEVHVEGTARPLKPARVTSEWPQGTAPASYPWLTVLGRTRTERDAMTGIPFRLAGQDVISADEAWGLWRVGEDVGEGVVHVFASYEAHRSALAHAVEQALTGNLDTLQGLGLPLPEAFLPPPFRGLLDPRAFPLARVSLAGPGAPIDDDLGAAGGVWRADVPFTWQAPRLAARRRLPDLRGEVTVTVAAPSEA